VPVRKRWNLDRQVRPWDKNVSLTWGLFLFPVFTGGAFLSLIPAIRRGKDYVADNGTPWQWPWFPWTLFGLLAAAACVRSYLLPYLLAVLAASLLVSVIVAAYRVLCGPSRPEGALPLFWGGSFFLGAALISIFKCRVLPQYVKRLYAVAHRGR